MKFTSLPMTWLVLSAAANAQATLTVALYDIAGVRPGILAAMKTETSSIFREAGILIEWVECAVAGEPVRNPECAVPLGSNRFMLRVVPGFNKKMPGVAGLSFLSNGSGVLAFVYPERIAELARAGGWDFGDLLGHCAAHELGHLLLRSESHVRAGLMSAQWDAKELRRLSHAALAFLPGQLREATQTARLSGDFR